MCVQGEGRVLEQMRVFASARGVLGPHGAGFANLVFCAPRTAVVEIGWKVYMYMCICVCVYVDIYICMYIYTCMYIYAYDYIRIRIYMYHIFIYIYI